MEDTLMNDCCVNEDNQQKEIITYDYYDPRDWFGHGQRDEECIVCVKCKQILETLNIKYY